VNHRYRTVLPLISLCALSVLCGLLAGAVFAQAAQTTQAAPTKVLTKTPEYSASAILIERSEVNPELGIPEEFRVATYENAIEQITKTGRFKQVFRSGDSRAKDVPDLVTMRMVPTEFVKGSEAMRGATTVKGWTSLKVKVTITDHTGKTLVDEEIQGRVRFIGDNLDATNDFAKKAASVVYANFKAPTQ
jgi:hypothetical protein